MTDQYICSLHDKQTAFAADALHLTPSLAPKFSKAVKYALFLIGDWLACDDDHFESHERLGAILDDFAHCSMFRLPMALGTKNRITHNATLCREHLRKSHHDKTALVTEFIAEIEGSQGDASWNQFTDLKRSDREMLQRVEEAFLKWLNP